MNDYQRAFWAFMKSRKQGADDSFFRSLSSASFNWTKPTFDFCYLVKHYVEFFLRLFIYMYKDNLNYSKICNMIWCIWTTEISFLHIP